MRGIWGWMPSAWMRESEWSAGGPLKKRRWCPKSRPCIARRVCQQATRWNLQGKGTPKFKQGWRQLAGPEIVPYEQNRCFDTRKWNMQGRICGWNKENQSSAAFCVQQIDVWAYERRWFCLFHKAASSTRPVVSDASQSFELILERSRNMAVSCCSGQPCRRICSGDLHASATAKCVLCHICTTSAAAWTVRLLPLMHM
jgi:hypothetical protein